MNRDIESVIKKVFSEWKRGHCVAHTEHPDEQAFACFFESRLSASQLEAFQRHILECRDCGRLLAATLAVKNCKEVDVPDEVLRKAKQLIAERSECPFFEVAVALKDSAIELLSAAGDVLVGQEFVPATLLRSRKQTDFKDAVTIFKDCEDIRVQIKISRRKAAFCDLCVSAISKASQKVIPEVRVNLFKGQVELESYVQHESGVVFENVSAGSYTVTISAAGRAAVSVSLQLKGPAQP